MMIDQYCMYQFARHSDLGEGVTKHGKRNHEGLALQFIFFYFKVALKRFRISRPFLVTWEMKSEFMYLQHKYIYFQSKMKKQVVKLNAKFAPCFSKIITGEDLAVCHRNASWLCQVEFKRAEM